MNAPTVAVLGGGPDAERDVSLVGSRAVADAIAEGGRFLASRHVIGRIGRDELRSIPGDVIFPVLHGPFGEGGELQDLLEHDGRPFVGCGANAARVAMDKMGTKLAAARAGVPTLPASVLLCTDATPPLPLPVVLKPIHEGSSVGVRLCRDERAWHGAREEAAREMARIPGRAYMVEPLVRARELTVGVLDPTGARPEALAPIEIIPAAEFYDYEAKYTRDDTRYVVDPELPAGVRDAVRERAVRLARALGVRHLCRVDFLLDPDGEAWMLEVNTMPGFTGHSLLPMGARAMGLEMPALTSMIVDMALRDAGRTRGAHG